ncbi:MAG: phosphotransferase [Tepidisphaeraceae bacterium]
MNALPPALTWMHLLPAGSSIECESCPASFVERVRRHAPVGNDAVVVINGGATAAKELGNAGYASARRFAVMPSLEKARWFIPLDSGRVAAGAFNIYTPARRSAHLKKFAVQVAARLRLPGWYRDEIVIASRARSPLEMKLAELFPREEIRVGLSAGAPELALNRKVSGAVLGAKGQVLAFVKLAESDIARRIARHEAAMLPQLSRRDELAGLTPKLLFAGEIDGRFVTVQSPLAAKNVPPARWTDGHDRFLAALRVGPTKPAAHTQLAVTLAARIASLPPVEIDVDLMDALEDVMPTLESMFVPSTIVHGDFAPWNLRVSRGRVSAFDWEYAELDGLPLIDQTHFAMQLSYQMQGQTPQAAQGELDAFAQRRPLGLEPQQVRALQAVYLLDSLARLLGEGYPADDDMIAWYTTLLGRLCPRRREAVAV